MNQSIPIPVQTYIEKKHLIIRFFWGQKHENLSTVLASATRFPEFHVKFEFLPIISIIGRSVDSNAAIKRYKKLRLFH
jgi:hypothetical protein